MSKFKILNKFDKSSLVYNKNNVEIYKAYKRSDDCSIKAFFIKIWEISDTDLLIKEIWLYEIRQLQALKNIPNANNYLSLIYNYYKDTNSFAIIYECNSLSEQFYKKFLDDDLKNITSLHNYPYSKQQIKKPLNRKKLWEDLLKIANGIKILHEKGLLHRNISIDNLLINVKEDDNQTLSISDFRLTGFDWLLSLHTFDETPSLYKEKMETELSFDTDWYLFGNLIQHFLFVNKKDDKLIRDQLPSYLLKKEKDLLIALSSTQQVSSHLYKRNYIDYIFVIDKIEEIITTLTTQNATKLNYILVPPKKYEVISSKYSQDDNLLKVEELQNIINNDLNLTELSITKIPFRNKNTYLLHGNEFIYLIDKNFSISSEKNTWSKAIIKKIYDKKPSFMNSSSITKIFNIKISVDSNTNTRGISWLNVINSFPDKAKISSNCKPFLNSMLLSYSLEVSDYFSRIFIVNAQSKTNNNKHTPNLNIDNVEVIIASTQIHENYCQLVHSKPMNALLNEMLNEESSSYENEWILSLKLPDNKKGFTFNYDENGFNFDLDSLKIELIYNNRKGGYYNFTLTNNLSSARSWIEIQKYFNNKPLYLYPKSLKGTYIGILRKKDALNLISNNDLLIKSITDPTDCILRLDYPFTPITETEQFDKSKKEIFKNILETYPNFVVQGPPGVGKTFLITTLIQQIFNDEKNSRIILSAQSHSTIKVLYEEILKLKLPENLIQLNEFSKEENETTDTIVEDITFKVNNTLESLSKSDFWKESYEKYNSLKPTMIDFIEKKTNTYRLLEDKIINCANIVLTTTNSKIIEDILKNGSYADWTIMEESGKASGLELISPLMLAPKRLIIGDHKQLPAFFEKNLYKILENLTYQNLIDVYQLILTGTMKPDLIDLLEINQFTDELEMILSTNSKEYDDDFNSNAVDIQNEFDDLKENTRFYFSLFNYLVKTSEKIKEQNQSISFGATITEQYRMHPNISKLVSSLFYDKKLTNNEKNEIHFLNIENRPFYYSNEWKYSRSLNKNSGIHFLNIKEPNEEKDIKSIEKKYTNEAEIYVIQHILNNINVHSQLSKKPTLIILSPYKKQVDLINTKIHQSEIFNSLLIKGFEVIDSEICKTIDSFQGGEADLVILSLVRHNINNDIYKSLGFLLDMRRLNVMLSRAKYQMIIIGSLGMFSYWINNPPQHISQEVMDNLKLFYQLITDPSQVIAEIIDITDFVEDFF